MIGGIILRLFYFCQVMKKLFFVAVSLLILPSCKNDKKGCTHQEAINYDAQAEINTDCQYVSDHLSGVWTYIDSFALTTSDSAGVLHTANFRDSGSVILSRLSNETIKFSIDSINELQVELSWKNKLTRNKSHGYLTDTIYSANEMCVQHYYRPKPDYKKEGRLWLMR